MAALGASNIAFCKVHQDANVPHRRLLSTRAERPRDRAAEQADELAASDQSCHLIPPAGRATEG
jgi:hypothetical protein